MFCLCFPLNFFLVSNLAFRSLMHFDFMFIYGIRKYFNFIILHVAVYFSQHHLLKRLFFSPLYILAYFLIDQVTIDVWVYLWTFYTVSLNYVSVFVSILCSFYDCNVIVYSEIREPDSSSSIFSFSR